MALRRGLVTVGAAVACCALTAACTSEPAPGATSSPTPVSTTTESQIERQMRLDYEAAEAAYRAAVAEHDRQAHLGVVSAEKLRRTATGAYLDFSLISLRRSRDARWRSDGETKILGVGRTGWQDRTIRLVACEDSSGVRFTDKRGRDVTPRIMRTYVQDLTVSKDGSDWKVADISSQIVQSFEGQPCAA